MGELISIYEAAQRGIDRLRSPHCVGPMDHLIIDIIDGEPGPLVRLYSPHNKITNGRDPVHVLAILQEVDFTARNLTAYDGPLPDSDEYKQAAAQHEAAQRREVG